VGVVLLLEDLRRDIERRSLDGLQEICGCRHLLGEAEVAQLDGPALQQDVLGFEVAVDHLILMEVQHRGQNLPAVVSHPLLPQPPLLEQARQVVSGVLHNHHHFLGGLEGLLHGDDILMFQFGQQLRLLRQTADLPRAVRTLGDGLERVLLAIAGDQEHLSERALSNRF